jgi:hypothetical protein
MWNNQLIHTTGLISQPVEQENYQWGYMLSYYYQWGYMLSCYASCLNIILECIVILLENRQEKSIVS